MWKDKYRYNIYTKQWDLIETELRKFIKSDDTFTRSGWYSKAMLEIGGNWTNERIIEQATYRAKHLKS